MAGSVDNRSYKSILFEYCQKKKIGPPLFETNTATDGSVSGYQSKVVISVTTFDQGGVFPKKKQAENEAAKVCLMSLGFLNDNNDKDKAPSKEATTDGDQDMAEIPKKTEEVTPEKPTSKEDQSTSPFAFPGKSPLEVVGKKPKSLLHEYCQKYKLPPPQYETAQNMDGSTPLGFTCVLTVNGIAYSNNSTFPTKRDAEHFMAAKALGELVPGGANVLPPYYSGTYQRSPASPVFSSPGILYKNLLQEHLHQRSLDKPIYDTKLTESGYKSSVTIEGKLIECQEECTTKKLAEQSAAKAGLIELGIKDPQAVALKLLRRRSKGRLQFPGLFKTRIPGGNERETWIHTRAETSFESDACDGADTGYTDFQLSQATPPQKRSLDSTDDDATPTKKQKVSESPDVAGRPIQTHPARRRGNEYDMQDVHLGNLSVGESWPEKRNVVIVGSGETSIPLYCNRERGRCALEDKKTSTVIDILPGHRLIGLEGHYVERGGQIVLTARQCDEVVMPMVPDKVLVSCGVVVLHCIPRKTKFGKCCDINILLKRYLCSQAFVNVVRGLAQFFRQKLFQRPITLDQSSIMGNISHWMLEEVMAIASMTEEAIRNVFRHTMKYDKRWGKILNAEELPDELKQLKAVAQQELTRRANVDEDQNEDRFRPWRLPKGNFHHRILSTGVFVESPAECAMRELREETGIRLKLNDITLSPYVDLLQSDNLNPHKGDVARYYLCGIITEDEDLAEGTNQEQPVDEEMESKSFTTGVQSASGSKTPDKKAHNIDANLIRSPSVAGALHEECTWYDVESAQRTSRVFREVYNSSEFQNLMANLTRIVSEM